MSKYDPFVVFLVQILHYNSCDHSQIKKKQYVDHYFHLGEIKTWSIIGHFQKELPQHVPQEFIEVILHMIQHAYSSNYIKFSFQNFPHLM